MRDIKLKGMYDVNTIARGPAYFDENGKVHSTKGVASIHRVNDEGHIVTMDPVVRRNHNEMIMKGDKRRNFKDHIEKHRALTSCVDLNKATCDTWDSTDIGDFDSNTRYNSEIMEAFCGVTYRVTDEAL